MCYFCPLEANANDILTHTISCHNIGDNKFSIRQRQLDEKLGISVYRSLHFNWQISTFKLNDYKNQGIILRLDTDQRKIPFKRKIVETQTKQNEDKRDLTKTCEQSIQTTILDTELCQLLQDVSSILKENDRYQDFLCVLKCIADKTLVDNIALHLLLDVGNFYSKRSI